MANTQINAQEQLLIELLNRARLDPAGEATRYGISLNDGLSGGEISTTPKAPLAWNADLGEAAANHSEWMLDTNTFSHSGYDGTDSGDRMRAAGYQFTGSWASGENISWRGTTGTLDPTAMILEQHKSLVLSPGHRVNIMGDFREVGVAQELGEFTGSDRYNASMITEDFARAGTGAFITGVAFDDGDGDAFYDVGEGRGGQTFDWLGDGGRAVTTNTVGGYGVAIPVGLSGAAVVAVTANGVTQQVTLTMTGTNVKLDLVSASLLAASTGMTLGANATDGRLLGVADIDLTGNSAANWLEGNMGANTIVGGDGSDWLEGGSGNDTLTGGAGSDSFVFNDVSGSATGSDRITDFAPGDTITIHLLATLPAESAWEDSHITSTTGGWIIALDGGSQITVAGGSLSDLKGALSLVRSPTTRETVLRDGSGGEPNHMLGGAGDDTYLVDTADDVVVEQANSGIDTVHASVSYKLGANLENLLLTGTRAVSGRGNGLDNVLLGNAGANRLLGEAGRDTLLGGNGNDDLQGGAGKDLLKGQGGADDFIFTSLKDSGPTKITRDTITDLGGKDEIDLHAIDAVQSHKGNQAFELDHGGAFEAGEIRQTKVAGGLLLEMNVDHDTRAEMSIFLKGVRGALSDGDFVL